MAQSLNSQWRNQLHAQLRDPRAQVDFTHEDEHIFQELWRRGLVEGKSSAVLILFVPGKNGPELLLTKRADHLAQHQGQIAFPGGRQDETDSSAFETALREAQEEVGIDRLGVEILGCLPPLPTSTGYRVEPIVAWSSTCNREALTANPQEIAEVFWVPWSQFDAPGVYRREEFESSGRMLGGVKVKYPTHVYQIGTYRIWGATAAMIHCLANGIKKGKS